MTQTLEAFKAELDAAGQPWNRLGLRLIGIGLVLFLVVQLSFAAGKAAIFLSDLVPNFFTILAILAVASVIVGWGLLIMAFFKRRQWRKAQVFEPPAP